MKISVDDVELYRLSEHQKDVIKNDIFRSEFERDARRRLSDSLLQKYEACFKRLKEEWDPKLSQRYPNLPTDRTEYANLVFSQPDYRDRQDRDNEVIQVIEIGNRDEVVIE